jgi:putative salt-induced outer membrane protein YdiY
MRKLMVLITILVLVIALPAILNGQVNTEKFRKEKDEDGFGMKLGLAMAIYKGNTDLLRLSSDLNINYKKKKNYLFLVGNITYGEKKKEAYINKGFAHLRGIRRFSKRFMAEAFAQLEFNEFIKLKRRNLLGGGIRILLLSYEKGKCGFIVNTGFGLMWEKELFNKDDGVILKEDTSVLKSTNYLSLRWAITDTLTLGNVTYLQFNIGSEKSTRIISDLNFDVKISKVLSYTAKLNYRYDNNPPLNVKNYDIQIKNGITLTL